MTSIPVTNAGGVTVSGLIPGVTYSIWSEGGPFHPHGLSVGDNHYAYQLSNDGGATWGSAIGTSFDPIGPASDTYVPSWAQSRKNLDSVHVLITFVASASSIQIRVQDTVFGDNTGSLDYEIGAGGLPFCEYGTSIQGPVTGGVIITTALIDLLLIAISAPAAVAVIFDGFVGKTLFTGDICGGLPPLMPQFTNADFLGGTGIPNPASLDKYWQALQAIAWPHFCQCNAGPIGSPPPIPVPPPLVLVPPAAPAGPISVACDSTDLCGLLNALMRQLAGMSASIAQLRSDVTLIQRQGVPFGFIPSASHAALEGTGELLVADLLGILVEYTSLPALETHTAGDPETFHNLGKISLGLAGGWRRSYMPTHNPYVIFPVSGAFTRVGYTLPPGAVITITELVREH